MVTGPGPLLASGRDADIFSYGEDGRLVLRRSRRGRSMAVEARVMDYVRSHGYPVPAVDHVSDDGTDLVMERVMGRSMVEELGTRPWAVGSSGRLLGELHRRLHEIPAPHWVPTRAGSEDLAEGGPPARSADPALLHLDLHPLNVMMGPSGPVVIDWTNAARGDPAVDVALSWAIVAAGTIPGNRLKAAALGWVRGLFIGSFLGGFDLDPVRAVLRPVVEIKVQDPNLSEVERRAMWAMVEKVEADEPS